MHRAASPTWFITNLVYYEQKYVWSFERIFGSFRGRGCKQNMRSLTIHRHWQVAWHYKSTKIISILWMSFGCPMDVHLTSSVRRVKQPSVPHRCPPFASLTWTGWWFENHHRFEGGGKKPSKMTKLDTTKQGNSLDEWRILGNHIGCEFHSPVKRCSKGWWDRTIKWDGDGSGSIPIRPFWPSEGNQHSCATCFGVPGCWPITTKATSRRCAIEGWTGPVMPGLVKGVKGACKSQNHCASAPKHLQPNLDQIRIGLSPVDHVLHNPVQTYQHIQRC